MGQLGNVRLVVTRGGSRFSSVDYPSQNSRTFTEAYVKEEGLELTFKGMGGGTYFIPNASIDFIMYGK